MSKKILIAFDDSENAMRAVKYVADTFSTKNKVTLFSVLPDTGTLCKLESPELSSYFRGHQKTFRAIENQKHHLIDKAQHKAQAHFVEMGFRKKDIHLKTQNKKHGVAHDIVNEAHLDFDLIVIGRRGISGFKEFFMGSVSHKVLAEVKKISVLIVN